MEDPRSDRLARVATALNDRASEVTAELVSLYERELPHLVHDDEGMVSLLSASVYQNIDTALRIFQHGIDPTRVEAPAAAIEYARRLAQRGTSVIDLIRAYYLGQMAVLDLAIQEGTRQIPDAAELGALTREALSGALIFIDRVTQQVVAAYEEERDTWLLNRSAVRAARVRSLLDGAVVDIDASETALAYRVRGHHVGLVAWYSETARPADALAGLEALAGRFTAKRPGAPRPLFVPHDELCAWVWLPVDELAGPTDEEIEAALAADAQVRVAVGEPGSGVEGFRRTHRQAARVHGLAVAAGDDCDRAMTFRDVGAMALMASDLTATRMWVEETLGELALDDEQHERLRETLRVFLTVGSSYTAAAERLLMHKNSVQYRVRRAQELLGKPVADNRLDVELALNLCHRLGGAVVVRR
ncbi:CdaR family transcriptional regulator [Amycolatopsis sp. 195334CR]|uniref:PucR family transcriptional regulator n=1 Tax=Amycolatopsis sp. 195334CR TaxID=2814588 RepID=UPI001A8D27A3|nr:helix-turn-helix domain-containing protein [Amycolatopsis sp. 195334CR]MBN6042201.1 helix-turn-helix domain-containing protein [Amycolatopsis sp. 195334CR]